jgi:hypothetical protein
LFSCGELGGVIETKAQTQGGSETGGVGGAGIVPPNPADIDLRQVITLKSWRPV